MVYSTTSSTLCHSHLDDLFTKITRIFESIMPMEINANLSGILCIVTRKVHQDYLACDSLMENIRVRLLDENSRCIFALSVAIFCNTNNMYAIKYVGKVLFEWIRQ